MPFPGPRDPDLTTRPPEVHVPAGPEDRWKIQRLRRSSRGRRRHHRKPGRLAPRAHELSRPPECERLRSLGRPRRSSDWHFPNRVRREQVHLPGAHASVDLYAVCPGIHGDDVDVGVRNRMPQQWFGSAQQGRIDAQGAEGIKCRGVGLSRTCGRVDRTAEGDEDTTSLRRDVESGRDRRGQIRTSVGLWTLPGMIDEPACTGGRLISFNPARGPEESSRRSLHTLDNFTATRLSTPERWTNWPTSWVASTRSVANTSGSPVSAPRSEQATSA